MTIVNINTKMIGSFPDVLSGFWYHKSLRYFHNFFVIYLFSDYASAQCHKPCMPPPENNNMVLEKVVR